MILVNGIQTDLLNVHDRGLMYGDGVFRTLRVIQGKAQCWQRHYRKLQQDCAALNINCPTLKILSAELETITRNKPECVIKIIITRGSGARGYRSAADITPNRIMMASPLPVYPASYAQQGVRVRICDLRLAPHVRLAGIKHLNRLENVLARQEWSDDIIAEGLLLDTEDHIIGGTMTNLFMVKKAELWTPNLSRCGVAGVQRERILEQAQKAGFTCRIAAFTLSQLLQADEIFLTNSVIGVWPVAAFEENYWQPGRFTAQAQAWINNDRD
ncbi:MAG: aminodeoxychorismate lyase [Burkholderiales bacterium]